MTNDVTGDPFFEQLLDQRLAATGCRTESRRASVPGPGSSARNAASSSWQQRLGTARGTLDQP